MKRLNFPDVEKEQPAQSCPKVRLCPMEFFPKKYPSFKDVSGGLLQGAPDIFVGPFRMINMESKNFHKSVCRIDRKNACVRLPDLCPSEWAASRTLRRSLKRSLRRVSPTLPVTGPAAHWIQPNARYTTRYIAVQFSRFAAFQARAKASQAGDGLQAEDDED